jgi:hypothetical protein
VTARRGAAAPDPAQRCLFAEPDLPTPIPPPRAAGPAPALDTPDALLRHPQAEREFRFGAHRIGYAFRRARRRSIGFVVGPEGLSVSAPRWVGLREVEAALAEKGDWIVRKLVEQRERSRRLDAARIEWRDGTVVPFLGLPVTVVLDLLAAVPGGAQLEVVANGSAAASTRALRIGLARSATPAQIRDAVQGWLQRQARRVFEERCGHLRGPPRRAGRPDHAVVGADALGQRQRERRDPPELAPDPLRAADDRLRRRPRAGASA